MAAPVKITTARNGRAFQGSGERVLDRDPKGTLWLAMLDGSDDVRPWYSTNQGNTWHYAGDRSEIDDINVHYPLAFHIDAEGYAHCVSRVSNTGLRYGRGTPLRNGKGWDWRLLTFSPSTEALDPHAGVGLVAFRVGQGWKAWVLAGTTDRDGGGNWTQRLRLTRIDIAANGGLDKGPTQVLRTETVPGVHPHGAITFQHTGDGKTATATPHLYVAHAVNASDPDINRQDPLQLTKLTYEAGAWTTGTPVTLQANTDTTGRTISMLYDGSRVLVGFGTRNKTVGPSSAALSMAEWDETSGTVTFRNPPAAGATATGYPLGVQIAVDPVTLDVFMTAYGETNDDPRWARFSRAGTSWGPWAVVANANLNNRPGRIAMKGHVGSSAIDLVYLTAPNDPFTIYYAKLTSINRAPTTPTLQAPASSSVADLATKGVVFRWVFNDPDPSDMQSAWQMRRKTTVQNNYEYYNAASDTWQGTAVWNTGDTDRVRFGSARWANGVVWQWSINTQDSGGLISGFAPDALVTASLVPNVTVTSPIAAYTEDSSPVVTWAYSSPNPQRTYRLRLFDLATYNLDTFDPASSAAVWDSGETSSVQARSVRVDVSLLNGGTYRAYMQVSDSLALYSDWSYGEFVLILTPAPAPMLEAVEETNYATGLKRVRLTVHGSTNMLSASQAYDHSTTSTDWINEANTTLAQAEVGSATVANRSLRMTAVGSGDMRVISGHGQPVVDTTGEPLAPARDFPASPLQDFTAVASFTASGAPRLCRLTLRFYNAGDGLLSSQLGDAVADIPGFPTQVTVSGAAPLGADRVRLVLEVLAAPAGDAHYVDRIDLHPGRSTTYSPGGLLAAQTFTVYRRVGVGLAEPVRTVNAVETAATQHLLGFDREMPFGVPVAYTAQAVTILGNGQPLASDPSGEAIIQLDSDVWGIRDPLDTDAEARGLVVGHDIDVEELATVYRPAGRSLPLVETEGVQGEDGAKLTVFVDRVAERQNLNALVRRPATLILQTPSGRRWYVRIIDRGIASTAGVGQTFDLKYVEVVAP